MALVGFALAMLLGGGAMLSGASGSPSAVKDPLANAVRAVGGAPSYGPATGMELNQNLVGIAATPSGRGYWVGAADGGVFTFGDAHFYGSAASTPLVEPVVGIAATPSGHGYWLVASDGGVFSFGDASFEGAATSFEHGAPIAAIAPTTSGYGYYLLGADGGVFAFGDARFYGSAVDGQHLATGIAIAKGGKGYQIARSDGSVVGVGGAQSVAASAGDLLAGQHPVVALAARPGGGAWLATGFVPPAPVAMQSQAPSDDPFLRCTRAHESDQAGGYRAVSPGGVYRGAYQFLPSTWNNTASAAGRPDLVGVDPAAAAPADQDQLALFLFHQAGPGPWGGRCAGLQ